MTNVFANNVVAMLFVTIAAVPLFAQGDKACYERIYDITDQLPTLKSPPEKLIQALQQNIKLPDSLRSKSGKIGFMYVINCNGDPVRFRKVKFADSDGVVQPNSFEYLSKHVVEIVRQHLKWNPALQGGKPVDFRQMFTILFNNGEIAVHLNAK